MSTPNFKHSKLTDLGLPLIVGGVGEDYDQLAESYNQGLEEGDEPYNEDMYNTEVDWDITRREEDLEDLNNKLEFFEVVIESGYYSGWQYNVKEIGQYDGYESIQSIDDETAQEYYGKSAAEVKHQVDTELVIVRDYLYSQVSDPYTVEIYCVGVFSNGEAIYKKKGQ